MDDMANLFSAEAEIVIYRIFQEILTNIGKHAQATRIEIVIKKTEQGVHFSVKDNGTGVDMKKILARTANSRGIGLGSMEERVRMLDGTLQLWSEEGKGTKISFVLPIDIYKPNEAAKH
jgi:signal transduction histidine kinase